MLLAQRGAGLFGTLLAHAYSISKASLIACNYFQYCKRKSSVRTVQDFHQFD